MTVASIGLLYPRCAKHRYSIGTKKWNGIGADVILAKKFEWLIRRRNTLVSEGVDSLLSCRHTVSIIPIVIIRCAHMALQWHCDVLI